MILYHGSPNKNITKLEITNNRTTGDEFGSGIYLTTDYEEAKQYAKNGKVYKVELNTDNLFNLNELLDNNMKQLVKNDLIENKDVYNQIIQSNRKQYEVKDKQEGLKFFKDKTTEWEQKDNTYFGNKPVVNKINDKLIVTYSDYEDIDSAIDKLTGDRLQQILNHTVGPNIFTSLVIKCGYDGIITHNNNWYIIYKNTDKVKIIESKYRVEEASRNELLVKTKGETISRYKRAEGYKGFNIISINTDNLLRDNTLIITCRVGKYDDTILLEDVLYWIQICAEEQKDNQINTKAITKALMNSIDGMDIKVDCECGDWKYRMAYQATEWGYKYGKPETRPAKITNPNGFGALCKHLTAMLSNKKWIQQVSGTVMDWCVKNIEKINEFIKPKEGKELTLPNELARQNAKAGFYTKLFKDKLDDEKEEPEEIDDNTDTQNDEEDFRELADVENTNKEDENEQ